MTQVGRAAETPDVALESRAYAGLDSAATAEQRAQLAVEDLARTGGFGRRTLVVITTTGSGWVDPGAVDSVEYMTGGDSATVSMQYSYLPSWMSYLVDQERAREAGRALFDAVYDRWSRLPMDNRPRLVVVGESLGSFGGETAFSGEYDLRNRTAGAIFAGPPNFNVLYREFVDGRDVGRLIAHQPDWLDEPRGDDVVTAMRWIPLVTFWQVSADLPFATEVPTGHGHVYTREYVDAWAHVLQPPAWTQHNAELLRAIISPPS